MSRAPDLQFTLSDLNMKMTSKVALENPGFASSPPDGASFDNSNENLLPFEYE